jgi:DNA-binding winged helix-turn-helix (wHTH) protein
MPELAKKVFRFGAFEADCASGELRKSGVRLKLQDQPFQVLLVLLERPGEVVSREELRQKLWPADTFVDFDHSLNTIINKLREVLGDSASNPRFIETLAKRGYRFLLPVEPARDSRGESTTTSAGDTASVQANPPASLLTRWEDLPAVPHGYVRVLFLLIQVMYLSFYIVALARLSIVEDLLAKVLRWPGRGYRNPDSQRGDRYSRSTVSALVGFIRCQRSQPEISATVPSHFCVRRVVGPFAISAGSADRFGAGPGRLRSPHLCSFRAAYAGSDAGAINDAKRALIVNGPSCER